MFLRQIGYDINPGDSAVLLNNTTLSNGSTLSDNNIEDSTTMEIIFEPDLEYDPNMGLSNGHA